MNLKQIVCKGVALIAKDQVADMGWILVNTLINLLVT
jgi:hypothetical protein